jgi:hypothetical protein
MAVTDFNTIDGQCGFEYQWVYVTSPAFGVSILLSVQKSGMCGFAQMTSTIFYIKTWQCDPPYYYFNLTTNMCQDACGDYNYENSTDYTCDLCVNFKCLSCNNPSFLSPDCTDCDPTSFRTLLNQTCECMTGYYDNGINLTCVQCS